MQATVANNSDLEKLITVNVSPEEVGESYHKILNQFAKKKRVDGFRPGKVPVKIIERYYRSEIIIEATDELVNKGLSKALFENKVKIAGRPKVTISSFSLESGLEFSATVSVYPDIEINDLSQLKLERVVSEVKDSDIDKMIDNIREQAATFKEAAEDAVVVDKDQVTINFVGSVDGKEFAGGKADNYRYKVGSHGLLNDMEDSLYGKKQGDKYVADVNFPENYGNKDLAGKTAQFSIEIVKIENIVLPELDEEYLKKLGLKSGTNEEFRAELCKNMSRQLQQSLFSVNLSNEQEALLEANTFEIPQEAVEAEARARYESNVAAFKSYYGANSKSLPIPEFDLSKYQDEAAKVVRISVIMDKIIKDNKITLDQQKLEDFIKLTASSYEDADSVINYYKSNKRILNSLEDMVLQQQVLDFVYSKAQVTDKEVSFFDLVRN